MQEEEKPENYNRKPYFEEELFKFYRGNRHEGYEQEQELKSKILNTQCDMLNKIRQLKGICMQLEQSLATEKAEMAPPLIIKEVKNVESKSSAELVSIINKLKVMVCKVQKKSSPNCEYISTTYMERITQTLDLFEFDETKPMINDQLRELKEKFPTLNKRTLDMHQVHPTEHPSTEFPIIFVDLYLEPLLFLSHTPLRFPSNLLFLPINYPTRFMPYTKPHLTISNWYLNQLQTVSQNWHLIALHLLIRFHDKPIVWARADTQDVGTFGGESQMFVLVRKVRSFVTLRLMANWLWNLFQVGKEFNTENLSIPLTDELALEISLSDTNPLQMQQVRENPHILSYLFEFCLRQENIRLTKKQIRQKFINQIKEKVIKIVNNMIA